VTVGEPAVEKNEKEGLAKIERKNKKRKRKRKRYAVIRGGKNQPRGYIRNLKILDKDA
jgi:hypothetical protein